jgi:diguanylate cyclase (GGDEF)-like protein
MRAETESRIKAMHDDLTGLPGPTLFRERFEQLAHLSRRNQWQMALLFLDLDGFKSVNDKLGHAAGDTLLVEVARRLTEHLRGTDALARLGGDEFVVLLADSSNPASVALVAERLLASISAPYWLDGNMAEVSASIGVAVFPDHGCDLSSLMQAADAAMYEAKAAGKNCYTVAATENPDRSRVGKPLKLVVG